MTCIVGLVDGGRVFMGGDSAAVSDYVVTIEAAPKVFRNGPCLIGFTSSFRFGQLMQYGFKPPRRHADTDITAYMVTEFCSELRACLDAAGYEKMDAGRAEAGTCLIGLDGRLFQMGNEYCFTEPAAGFLSCGSGREFALGSLASTSDKQPETRIRMALEAAALHCTTVCAPFHIEALA